MALVGQLDHELVDSPALTASHDVDRDDIGPDRADAAGDGTEGTGPVGQSHPEQEGSHAVSLGNGHERRVSVGRRSNEQALAMEQRFLLCS
jgi:hypothetical protein